MQLTVNDFFCGAGGMSLGFKLAGFEIKGAWDIDKHAVKSYRHNIGDHVEQRDIRCLSWSDVPKADVWAFGFPYQDLSIANPEREGLSGERSGLFFEIMRLLDETIDNAPHQTPKILLAENVLGLREYIPRLILEYNKRGYKAVFDILDSQNFGVPQHRERYFIVGIRKDYQAGTFKFPEPYNHKSVVRDILLPESEVDEKYYLSEKAIAYMHRHRKGKPRWEYHKNPLNGVASTITANIWKGVPYGVIKELMRRLTPRECAKLQGFPDSYEQVVSDTQFYKQMGNAVTVTVAKELAVSIKKFLRWFCNISYSGDNLYSKEK